MLSEKDVLTWQEHHKDLLREAQQDRIAHQALAGQRRRGLYQRALAWLGAAFVAWGCFLRRRYAFGLLQGQGTASLNSTSSQDCGCA